MRKILDSKPYSNVSLDDYLSVVLCEVPGNYQPCVTWIYNSNNNSYFWGHYFDSLDEAKTDYDRRGVKSTRVFCWICGEELKQEIIPDGKIRVHPCTDAHNQH